jgi:hypothetical protein
MAEFSELKWLSSLQQNGWRYTRMTERQWKNHWVMWGRTLAGSVSSIGPSSARSKRAVPIGYIYIVVIHHLGWWTGDTSPGPNSSPNRPSRETPTTRTHPQPSREPTSSPWARISHFKEWLTETREWLCNFVKWLSIVAKWLTGYWE